MVRAHDPLCSLAVVRKAVDMLRQQGLVITRQGKVLASGSALSGAAGTCQGRAFGVPSGRPLTEPARSPGVRSYREPGEEWPKSTLTLKCQRLRLKL